MGERALNPNKIGNFLDKSPSDFTKKDIIQYIEKNNIKMVNFRYVGGDGRLKLLNFVINSKNYLEKILSLGERVDGSSLFSYIAATSSDLYVVPRYKTAFVNPFTETPSIDLLCSFYTREGKPLESAPEYVLRKAATALKEKTGFDFEALGELEFYISSELDQIYKIIPQKGYHESHPYSKWEFIRVEAMKLLSEMGCQTKYGHAEVGNIIANEKEYVQHEIEFLPVPVCDAADQLVIGKWALRKIAYKYGLEISFAPKIIVGHAGSGLHIHARLVKDGKNMIVDKNGSLNDTAKKMIGGYLDCAQSLSAFGNTVPTSFLRLVPHQEAPTNICWGDSNRSVLVRVPLGWSGVSSMSLDANPLEKEEPKQYISNQTIEIRSPDGSAHVYSLLAGLCVAARHGLESKESIQTASELYVKEDANKSDLNLPQLPTSCNDAGERLIEKREIYEKYGVFPTAMIDGIAETLKSYNDNNLSSELFGNANALQDLVDKHFHCG